MWLINTHKNRERHISSNWSSPSNGNSLKKSFSFLCLDFYFILESPEFRYHNSHFWRVQLQVQCFSLSPFLSCAKQKPQQQSEDDDIYVWKQQKKNRKRTVNSLQSNRICVVITPIKLDDRKKIPCSQHHKVLQPSTVVVVTQPENTLITWKKGKITARSE